MVATKALVVAAAARRYSFTSVMSLLPFECRRRGAANDDAWPWPSEAQSRPFSNAI